MKLLRLRLRDYRGVAEREVEFLARGVTVVQGPNESGKSSLAEAIDLLFDKRDSSVDRAVRAVQPAGRDVGSEVELLAESGPYRFRYFKRFNRQPETVLQVTAPVPEELTGRPAHERADEILGETLDRALWRALRVEQGVEVGQGALGEAPSLLAALDRAAAGGVLPGSGSTPAETGGGAGARDEALFDRVRSEYLRYFTEVRGQPAGEQRAAEEEAAAARTAMEALEAELALLEADVQQAGGLERRIVQLRGEVAEAQRRATAARTRLAEIQRLDGEVQRLRAVLADEEARRELLAELAAAEHEEREVAGSLAAARRRVAEAEAELAPAAKAAAEAEAEEAGAVAEAERARRVEQLAADRARLVSLRRERDRLAELEVQRERLAARLAANRVTEQTLRGIEDKDRAVERATAAVEARRAGLAVRALRRLALEVDGEEVVLDAGEMLERQVAAPLDVTFPGVADVRVVPGGDLAELRRRLEESRRELADACSRAGVNDTEAARRAHHDWREAAADLQGVEAGRRELLAGRTPERVAAEIAALEAAVAASAAAVVESGGSSPPEPETAAEAPPSSVAAEESLAAVRERAAARRSRRDDLARRLEGERRVARELEIHAGNAADRVARARGRIARQVEATGGVGRSGGEDDQIALFDHAAPGPAQARLDLAPALAAAERRAQEARTAFDAARRRLADARPEEAEQAAEAAASSLDWVSRELRGAQDEQRQVRGRLEARGERSLFEALAEARSAWAEADVRRRSVAGRAAAARRLFLALGAARDRARQTYGGPLRRWIVELGRPLFGPDFSVELDDQLRVARRTLGGTTLDYDQLSTGAREQLALLARLAAARLAARDPEAAGAPLVVDDGLGYSDPVRLEALGDLLTRAGEDGQVIVLTCFPDRYRHLRGARVVTL